MPLLDRAKALRSGQTEVEQRLWYYLRGHRFMGLKFRRQKPVGPYIVDFVCHELGLIVEADGGQHQENAHYDQRRDAWLTEQGYTVLRFWNNDVLQRIESVLEAMRLAVEAKQAESERERAHRPRAGNGPGTGEIPPSSTGSGEEPETEKSSPLPRSGRGGGGEGGRKTAALTNTLSPTLSRARERGQQ